MMALTPSLDETSPRTLVGGWVVSRARLEQWLPAYIPVDAAALLLESSLGVLELLLGLQEGLFPTAGYNYAGAVARICDGGAASAREC